MIIHQGLSSDEPDMEMQALIDGTRQVNQGQSQVILFMPENTTDVSALFAPANS